MRGGSGLAWPRGTALDLEVEERKRLDGPLKGWLDHMAASSRGRSVASFSQVLLHHVQPAKKGEKKEGQGRCSFLDLAAASVPPEQ